MKARFRLITALGILATTIGALVIYGLVNNAAVGATSNNLNVNRTISEGAVTDVSCEVGALPNLQDASASQLEMASLSGFSNKPADLESVLGRVDAGIAARLTSTDLEGSVDAPVAATQVPYRLAAKWIDDTNDLIAPERCTWVVTVKASFTPSHHGPIGAKVSTYDRYTVVMDAASGEGIATLAGPSSPDMFTGKGLG